MGIHSRKKDPGLQAYGEAMGFKWQQGSTRSPFSREEANSEPGNAILAGAA